MILIFTLEKVQPLAPVSATLLAKRKRSFLSLSLITRC